MKKNLFIFVLASVLMVSTFCGCSGQKQENRIQLRIGDETTENIIPDPAQVTDEVAITLRGKKLVDAKTDLSFLGYDQEVVILRYAVAQVTGFNDFCTQLTYLDREICDSSKGIKEGIQDRVVPGSCLVLSVAGISPEEGDDAPYIDLVVLDYATRKSYRVGTEFFYGGSGHIPKLELRDLTGDGLEDLVISHAYNGYRSGTEVQVYRFDSQTEELKEIYNNFLSEENEFRDEYFTGYLKDNYKGVIQCKEIGFEKEFSLLDNGYKKRELEIGMPPERDDYDATKEIRLYRNKKLTQECVVHQAPLDDAEGIQYFEGDNMKRGLRFRYNLWVGKYETAGIGYAYLQYDEETDWLEVKAAKYEDWPEWY